MEVTRQGRVVSYAGRRYEFLTVEQAMGFARFLDQGKDLEHASRIWRPKRIVADVRLPGAPEPPA